LRAEEEHELILYLDDSFNVVVKTKIPFCSPM